jgi:hypothetical protein
VSILRPRIVLCLSEAIRIGSLLVPRPTHEIENCAIGMALKAIGALPLDTEDQRSYYGDRFNQWHTLAHPIEVLKEVYPWLREGVRHCPCCFHALDGACTVYHLFDEHVMCGEITIDTLCDWIASVEPHPEAPSTPLGAGSSRDPKAALAQTQYH